MSSRTDAGSGIGTGVKVSPASALTEKTSGSGRARRRNRPARKGCSRSPASSIAPPGSCSRCRTTGRRRTAPRSRRPRSCSASESRRIRPIPGHPDAGRRTDARVGEAADDALHPPGALGEIVEAEGKGRRGGTLRADRSASPTTTVAKARIPSPQMQKRASYRENSKTPDLSRQEHRMAEIIQLGSTGLTRPTISGSSSAKGKAGSSASAMPKVAASVSRAKAPTRVRKPMSPGVARSKKIRMCSSPAPMSSMWCG